MKKLLLIVLFAICSVMMAYEIIHYIGEFTTHSKTASGIIYASLVLFSYKLTYFIFDLTYSCLFAPE